MADGDSTGPEGGDPSERLVTAVERLVTAIEDVLEEQRKPQKWLPRNATTISVLVSAGVLCATILFSVWQLNASSQQFEQTLRRRPVRRDRQRPRQLLDRRPGQLHPAASSVRRRSRQLRR